MTEKNEEKLEELEEINESHSFLRSTPSEVDSSGTPFLVKDAICVKNEKTSAGSEIIENYKPVFDATVVERLKDSGYTYFGKTSQDEFGFGTFCLNCQTNETRNAVDPERVAGGSSGGAAVAARVAEFPLLSIGESTGGSISNPASYNGVIGFTPTYGRVSRNGLIDYGNSLDKIGVLAQDLDLIYEGFKVIAGEDNSDQTTVDRPVPDDPLENLDDIKVGVPQQLVNLDGMQQRVQENFRESLETMEDNGVEVEEVDAEWLDPEVVVPAYYIIAMAEASTNLARFTGMRYGKAEDPEKFDDFREYFSEIRSEHFGSEAVRRIMIGTYVRKAGYRDKYYVKAAKVRTKVIEEFKRLFEEYDVLATPTMPNIAPKVEQAESMDPTEIYAMDGLTVSPNFAGMPMISLPNGSVNQMPTGLHLIADQFEEKKLLDIAHTFDGSVGSYRKRWNQ